MPYAAVDDLKAQINKTSSDDDAVLLHILEAATQAIDHFCNRPDGFVALSTATARVYAGSGQSHQWIDECVEVTLVEVRYDPYDPGYVAWAATDWVAFQGTPEWPEFNRLPYQGLLVSAGGKVYFPAGTLGKRSLPTVRVTAKWGYATAAPPVVEQACITQAARWYKRGQSAWSDTLANGDFGVLQFRKALDPDLEMMLRAGRLVRPAIG